MSGFVESILGLASPWAYVLCQAPAFVETRLSGFGHLLLGLVGFV
jgi:hypothetical protein